jgi:molybdopterin molybdotransferase
MIPFEDALRIVLENVPAPTAEDVPLMESVGRALSRDILADRDAPPFDASAMDGYALRAGDAAYGAVLRIVEEIPAGRVPRRAVGAGEAAVIMTGAPLPAGADAVVRVEETERIEDRRAVRLLGPITRGEWVRPRGENRRAGDVVLRAGQEIRPAEIAVLASSGHVRAPAYVRPTVVIASTGDELVPVEATPGPGQIRNSNSVVVMAQARAAGAHVLSLGIVEDEIEATRRMIREGLAQDVLLVSGGVSMGERDFVVECLRAEGVEILFHKVATKPGKPLAFGRHGRTLVFGVPGNPVSAFVTFEVFVRPALRKLMGHTRLHRTIVDARPVAPIPRQGSRRTLLPARVQRGVGGPAVRLVRYRGSGDPHGVAEANALVIVPAGGEVENVETVPVMLLDGALEADAS